MSHATGEHAQALQLLRLAQLLVESLPFGDVADEQSYAFPSRKYIRVKPPLPSFGIGLKMDWDMLLRGSIELSFVCSAERYRQNIPENFPNKVSAGMAQKLRSFAVDVGAAPVPIHGHE